MLPNVTASGSKMNSGSGYAINTKSASLSAKAYGLPTTTMAGYGSKPSASQSGGKSAYGSGDYDGSAGSQSEGSYGKDGGYGGSWDDEEGFYTKPNACKRKLKA